jgi:hypothetical protein
MLREREKKRRDLAAALRTWSRSGSVGHPSGAVLWNDAELHPRATTCAEMRTQANASKLASSGTRSTIPLADGQLFGVAPLRTIADAYRKSFLLVMSAQMNGQGFALKPFGHRNYCRCGTSVSPRASLHFAQALKTTT